MGVKNKIKKNKNIWIMHELKRGKVYNYIFERFLGPNKSINKKQNPKYFKNSMLIYKNILNYVIDLKA